MSIDGLEKSPALPPEFQQAAQPAAPAEPPRVMVSLPLDADVLAYFQGEAEPSDWQGHLNGVLRYYMDTNLAREADTEFAARTGPEPSYP